MNTQPNVVALRVQEIPPANTVEEAAVWLRFKSPTTVYSLLEDGKLKSIVIGGKRLVTGASIIELLHASEQQTYARTRESPKKRNNRERATV